MQQARHKIRTALTPAQSPAVLWSGGKDSMLLLTLAREVRTDLTVLWFRDGTDETFAKRIIREWGLTAFSWAPADRYLLHSTEGTVLINEYSFGPDRLPMLTDLIAGTKCSLTMDQRRTPQLFLPFDVILWGAKDTDTHWVKGSGQFKEDGYMLGTSRVIAPIRHMSNEQVRAALNDLNIPYRTATDELPICTACMTASASEVYCPERGGHIPRVQWEADKTLTAFRNRFGLEGTNGRSIHQR